MKEVDPSSQELSASTGRLYMLKVQKTHGPSLSLPAGFVRCRIHDCWVVLGDGSLLTVTDHVEQLVSHHYILTTGHNRETISRPARVFRLEVHTP